LRPVPAQDQGVRPARRRAEPLDSKAFNRVSRIHCEIEYQPDGQVAVRDLSQNGTLVDGVRVGRSHLFRVGPARVVVELVDGTWGKLLLTETGAAAAAGT